MAMAGPQANEIEAGEGTASSVAGRLRFLLPFALIAAVAVLAGVMMRRNLLAGMLGGINPLWLAAVLVAVAVAAIAAAIVFIRRRAAGAVPAPVIPATSPEQLSRISRIVNPKPVAAAPQPALPAVAEEPVTRPVIESPPLQAAHEPDETAIGDQEAAMVEDDDHEPLLGEIDVAAAAEKIIAGGIMRAVFVSPEGDEAAAVSVLVAREIADAGLRVLAIDMTAAGAVSRPMLDGESLPGVTDLLVGAAQFTDAIHEDHYSACHVMPVGGADPVAAMAAADRLPSILDALEAAYDVVVVECGPADAEAIAGLTSKGASVFVSVLEADELIAEAADALVEAGLDEITLVAPGLRSPVEREAQPAL